MSYQSDAAYVKVVPLVLNSEGGYVNDPNDPGGPTKYGIALHYNQEILRELGVTDVKLLTYEQAKEIYHRKYWLPSGAPHIPDLALAYIHFDAAVNCGVGMAGKFLSRLSRDPADYQGGGKNQALFRELFIEYLAIRMRYYTSVQMTLRAKYLAGWMNRLADVSRNALTKLRGAP